MSGFPSMAIDEHVPPAIRRDIARMLDNLRAAGGSAFLIQVPAEDFARTIDAVARSVLYPFAPTLCGEAVAPWEKQEIGIITRARREHTSPLLYTADGREHAFEEI